MFSSLYLIPPFPLGTIPGDRLIIFPGLKTASWWLSAKRPGAILLLLGFQSAALWLLWALGWRVSSCDPWIHCSHLILPFGIVAMWSIRFYKHFPLIFGDARHFPFSLSLTFLFSLGYHWLSRFTVWEVRPAALGLWWNEHGGGEPLMEGQRSRRGGRKRKMAGSPSPREPESSF